MPGCQQRFTKLSNLHEGSVLDIIGHTWRYFLRCGAVIDIIWLFEPKHDLDCSLVQLCWCLLFDRWKGMVPDMLVLCVIVMFGVDVVQRVHYVIRHDHGSLLRSIYERTGLLLDILILGLQAFGKPLPPANSCENPGLCLLNLPAGLSLYTFLRTQSFAHDCCLLNFLEVSLDIHSRAQ